MICNEFNLIGSLNCPNILKMHEVFFFRDKIPKALEYDSCYVQTMELCSGGTLDEYIKKRNEKLDP
jgi:serine/threonine protein kinase